MCLELRQKACFKFQKFEAYKYISHYLVFIYLLFIAEKVKIDSWRSKLIHFLKVPDLNYSDNAFDNFSHFLR